VKKRATNSTTKARRRRPLPAISVRRAPAGPAHRAILRFGPRVFQASIGRNGTTARKREGDGKTPIATMPLLYGYTAARKPVWPASPLRLKRSETRRGWCDDPASPNYNRPVRLPFDGGYELLRRNDHIYDAVIVLAWNITSRVRNRGSAIFFHLKRPDHGPTAGCIALTAQDMALLLPHLKRGLRLVVHD